MGEVSMRAELATDPKLAGLVNHLSASADFTRWMLAPARAAALLNDQAPCQVTSLIAAPVLQHFALGMLIKVWDLGKCHSRDGFLPGLDFDTLNNLLGVPSFAQAMSEVGWARESEAPRGVVLPKFERYNGARKEKESKKRLPATDPLEIQEPSLAGPAFKEAWGQWVRYRRQMRKPLTKSTLSRQQKKLAGMGVEQAVASIHQSIEHGWQGLFPPKGDGSGRTTSIGRGADSRLGRVEAPEGKYDHLKGGKGAVPPPPPGAQASLFPGEGPGDGPGAPERQAGDPPALPG